MAQLDHAIPPSEQAAEGQALAEKWRDAAPAENAEYTGALKIRKVGGETETVPLNFKIIVGKENWQTIYDAKPTPQTPGGKLVIIHTPGQPSQYLVAQGAKPGQAAGPPLPVTGRQLAVPFVNSDFWLSDLGLEFFHWPTQRLLRTEMRKGQVTKVLESLNPNPNAAYARVVTWLDKESGAPIVAEAYDRAGTMVKQFSIKSVKKVKGQYQLQEMQISNPAAGTRTRIEYVFEKE